MPPLSDEARGRALADLAGRHGIGREDVAEAIQYRSLDRAPRR